MFKKVWIYVLFLICLSSSAHAGDKEVWRQVYRLFETNYIDEINISDIFNPSIKALEKIDKNVRIATEEKTVTLYYQGRINRTYNRPFDEKNAEVWADFTTYLMNEFKKVSPQLDNHDFEMTDIMLYNGIKAINNGMRYYPSLDIGQEKEKVKRFGASLLENDILYIRLGTINDYTLNNIKQAFNDYRQVQGILLDLRDNKGGYLKQALELTDMFLSSGPMIYTLAKDKGSRKVYNSNELEIYKDIPLVIIIDGQTASAAEVLSLVLQERARAIIVGSQSYGKGTVQNIYKLANNAFIALTTERFFSFNHTSVDEKGVRPNICSGYFEPTVEIDEVIQQSKNGACPKLTSQRSFDFEVAIQVLKNEIKKGQNKKNDRQRNNQ